MLTQHNVGDMYFIARDIGDAFSFVDLFQSDVIIDRTDEFTWS